MGTRSLTVVRETEGAKDICVLYRQMDGYPTGHGAELKEFLAPFTVVNGYSLEDTQAEISQRYGMLGRATGKPFQGRSDR